MQNNLDMNPVIPCALFDLDAALVGGIPIGGILGHIGACQAPCRAVPRFAQRLVCVRVLPRMLLCVCLTVCVHK